MHSGKIFDLIKETTLKKDYKEKAWTGKFSNYLDMVVENPKIARTAFQRLYAMISSYGYTTHTEYKKKIVHWNFFDDPIDNGKDAIYGLDIHLMKLVNVIKSGAMQYGSEKRVILLHGPVGSAKSTIVRLLKKGLEQYTAQNEGALYSYKWKIPKGTNKI